MTMMIATMYKGLTMLTDAGKCFVFSISIVLKVCVIVPILQMNTLSLNEIQILPQDNNAKVKIQPKSLSH
jgi:hypothetical protein